MSNLSYHLIFRAEPEGGFTVLVPALPGCVTYGKTLAQAKKMAADAIKAYIWSLKKHGEPIPSGETIFIDSIQIRKDSSKRARTPALVHG